MFVIFGASSSALTAAYRCADMGEDVTIIEPTHRKWYMWNSGLTQTDRESTFAATSTVSTRWGSLSEFQRRANIIAGQGATSSNLFFTSETVNSAMEAMMADFASARAGKGIVTVVTNAGLQKVFQDPQTNVITAIRCGGVNYPGMNFHDATDEGDLVAAAGCMSSYGRNSSLGSMDDTSGVRAAGNGATTVRATNLTGRRRPRVGARSSKVQGDADLKFMAFNQRILVTDSANRIPWADLVIPDFNPADYDLDFEMAKYIGLATIPGSISNTPMYPVGENPQYDMNNGGLLKFGSNKINEFLQWLGMNAWERIAYHGVYTANKAGLFKDICTNPRWLEIPSKTSGGVTTQIVTETKKWGLVPGVFVEAPWTGGVAVTVNTVVANGSSLYICTRAGTTAASGGPTGKGTAILDGSGVAGAVWRFLRYYVPGMSPHMYVREGRRIVGEIDQQYDDVTAPEHDIAEPVTAYGYPHADAHWVNIYANELGLVDFEGGSGLAGSNADGSERAIVAAIMPWGALKANYADCPNLTVSRATAGTKQGWLVSRLEMCYMKFGDVCGMAAAVCKIKMIAANDNKPVYTGDLIYKNDLQARLIAAGAPLFIPKAA